MVDDNVGALLHFAPWPLNWFDRLPGDIQMEAQQGKVFIHITSMLIISVILTVLVNLFKR